MENLKEILEQHQLWVDSNGKKGLKANLSGATLSGVNLENANLSGATLEGATLLGANLSFANLSFATLSGAIFLGANLSGANLSGATLSGVNLENANLSGATLEDATLLGANLSFAKGISIFQKFNGRICYAVQHEQCLMIKVGCFWGTLEEFKKRCFEKYGDDKSQNYHAQIAYLENLTKELFG